MKYTQDQIDLLNKKTELEIQLARTTAEKEFFRKKLYYYKNKDLVLNKQKERYKENADQKRQYQKEYNEKNKETQNEKKKKRYEELKKDPQWLEKERERLREYKRRNREKLKQKGKEYRENNKEKRKETQFKYRLKNKEKIKLLTSTPEYRKRQAAIKLEWIKNNYDRHINNIKKYKRANPEKVAWYNSQRNEKLKKATIGGNMFKSQILKIYKEKYRLNEETGILHHTDHQIPLNHPLVCGLNVPWNLKNIPAKDNLKKSNNLDPKGQQY